MWKLIEERYDENYVDCRAAWSPHPNLQKSPNLPSCWGNERLQYAISDTQQHPAGAITEKGHDKKKCQAYLRNIGYSASKEYDNDTSVAGCGLCQVKVPCEFKNPTKNLEKKTE